MWVALACLWIGFATGFICSSLLAGQRDARRAGVRRRHDRERLGFITPARRRRLPAGEQRRAERATE
jgi:hypothetical protein